jgi:hypothetical protein
MVARGQVVRDSVVIKNPMKRALTVTLYPADGHNIVNGGAFAFSAANQKPTGAGTWIALAASKVTVPAGEQATVPITIAIPDDANPGQLVGGVVAQDTAVTQTLNESQLHVGVRIGLGVRVYLQVAGALHPALAVDGVHVTNSGTRSLFIGGGTATLHYAVVNTGNQTLNATSRARVVNTFGQTVYRFPEQKLVGLLANDRVQFSPQFKLSMIPGRYRVEVDVKSDSVSAHDSTETMIAPLSLLFAAILAIVATIVAIRQMRRRREVSRGRAPLPEPSKTAL